MNKKLCNALLGLVQLLPAVAAAAAVLFALPRTVPVLAAAAATAGSSCTSGSSVLHRFLFIPTPPDTEKQGRLHKATLLF